jgi:hypothetical protein
MLNLSLKIIKNGTPLKIEKHKILITNFKRFFKKIGRWIHFKNSLLANKSMRNR